MKYKLIACDMDGTFLNDRSEIPKNNMEYFKILQEEYGVKFVPSSGRGYQTLTKEIKWLDLNKGEGNYIIGLNGAAIVDISKNKTIYFDGLDYELSSKIYNFGLEKKVSIPIYTKDNLYITRINEDEKRFLSQMGVEYQDFLSDNIEFLKHEPIAKILFENTDLSYLYKIKEELISEIGDTVGLTFSSNRYLEINGKGVNKGTALKKLCKHLGIDIKETIAIGDNHNDLDMLKVAGISVAVSNAEDYVKEMVDYVADASNNEGVLEEVFNKFIK